MGAVVFFAFILFVMGGFTAYMGDRMGSYIGKKRHSTFGLRPRHTAMLWTVVSGGVIAVGTLLLFLAWNKTFSTALVRGSQLLLTNNTLEKQNGALTRHNFLTEQKAQADNLRAEQAQKARDDAQAQAKRAQEALSKVSVTLGQSNSALAQSHQALVHRQAALAAAQKNLADAKSGLRTTHAELGRAEERVRVARLDVKTAQKQYHSAIAQVAQANISVLALAVKQDTLTHENQTLTRQNQEQQNLLSASQGHTLIFRRDEELGRTVVAANQPLDALRRELAVFLDQVELTARQRGAGGLDNSPAVVIPVPGAETQSSAEAREAALDALSQNIAAKGGFLPSIVVVADARFNTFKGEAVKLDLRPYDNILVFSKGMVIASSALDGSQSEDVILKRLETFLKEQVRGAALKRGIIPVRDPQSGEPQVGQPIDTPTALALVKQIQEAGPQAHVTASAAEDTYSADLLHLDLQVTPPPVTPSATSTARG